MPSLFVCKSIFNEVPTCSTSAAARARTIFFRIIHLREVAVSRPLNDVPVSVVTRTVAWTVPGTFQCIPVNNTTKVTTDGGALMNDASVVLIHRYFRQAPANDCS